MEGLSVNNWVLDENAYIVCVKQIATNRKLRYICRGTLLEAIESADDLLNISDRFTYPAYVTDVNGNILAHCYDNLNVCSIFGDEDNNE